MQTTTNQTCQNASEEAKKLRKEYHLIRRDDALVFSWLTKEFGRFRVTFGRNEERAKQKALQWIAKIEDGIDPRQEERAKFLSIEDLFTEALYKKEIATGRASSLKRYKSALYNFSYWATEQSLTLVKQITSQHIDEYFYAARTRPIIPNESRKGMRAVRVNGAAAKTLKFEYDILKFSFGLAVSKGIISENPVKDIKLRDLEKLEVEAKSYHEHEIPILLNTAANGKYSTSFGNCTMREVLEFLFLTGLREGELLHLRWEDVVLNAPQPRIILQGKTVTETLTVPFSHSSYQIFAKLLKGKSPDDYVFSQKDLVELKPYNRLPIRREKILSGLRCKDIHITTKSLTISFLSVWKPKGQIGAVPLTKRCQEILQTIASRSGTEGFVFQGSYGGKIQNSLLKIIKRITKEAGIDETGRKLYLHSTRHTFGCTLRNKDVPVETIQGLMRHRDLRDTLHYAKYNISKGAEAVFVLDSLVEEQ